MIFHYFYPLEYEDSEEKIVKNLKTHGLEIPSWFKNYKSD